MSPLAWFIAGSLFGAFVTLFLQFLYWLRDAPCEPLIEQDEDGQNF